MTPRVLFVCTGNICRSPMAEYLLRERLGSSSSVTVASAGIAALTDSPVHPQTLRVLSERGIDAEDFRARYLTPELIRSADLVVGLSREHRDHATAQVPIAWRRIVAFRELGETIAEGGQSIAQLRIGGDRNRPDLDIDDPMGRPAAEFDRVADELDPLVNRLAAWLPTA